MDPPPEYMASRDAFFQQLLSQYNSEVQSKEPVSIIVTLPDGKVVEAESWKTTPYDVARGIR